MFFSKMVYNTHKKKLRDHAGVFGWGSRVFRAGSARPASGGLAVFSGIRPPYQDSRKDPLMHEILKTRTTSKKPDSRKKERRISPPPTWLPILRSPLPPIRIMTRRTFRCSKGSSLSACVRGCISALRIRGDCTTLSPRLWTIPSTRPRRVFATISAFASTKTGPFPCGTTAAHPGGPSPRHWQIRAGNRADRAARGRQIRRRGLQGLRRVARRGRFRRQRPFELLKAEVRRDGKICAWNFPGRLPPWP